MAKGWDESAGEAKKKKLEYITFGIGTTEMRLVGDIVPRYAYWRKLKDFNIPVECLSFDREKEEFTNIEKDWFREYFPKQKNGKPMYPSWAYVIKVIDLKDGKVKLCGLKKKLYEQIQSHAKKHLGDPTDPKTGWKIVLDKKSTGPLPINIEYTLDQMACEVMPLTEDQIDAIAATPPIDELVPRLTSDQQRAFIEASWIEKREENVDNSAADKVAADDGFDDDIPF